MTVTDNEKPRTTRRTRQSVPPFEPKPSETKQDKTTVAPPPMRPGAIAKGMTNFYTMLSLGVGMFDMQIAGSIAASAEGCGAAWEELAKTNPKVRRALMALIESSAAMKLVAAHMPIGVAVVMRYGPEPVKEKVGNLIINSFEEQAKANATV